MAEKSPYIIKVYASEDGGWTGEISYKGEFVKRELFSSDYKSTIEGKEYSGKKAVELTLESETSSFGFFERGKLYPPFTKEEKPEETSDFEKKQKELFNKTGDLGDKIPGLDKDTIIEELAKKEPTIKASIEKIQQAANEDVELGMSEEEATEKAKEEIKKMIDGYKKNIEDFVNTRIIEINQQYTVFKKSVESIPDDVKGVITNIALPATVTAPPGAPNPVYALNLAKSTKNSIAITLSAAIAAFAVVLKLCTELKFKLPDSILSIFDKISGFSKLLESIPV